MLNTLARDTAVYAPIQDPGQEIPPSNTERETPGSDKETSRDTSRPRVPASILLTDDVMRFLESVFNNRNTGYPLLSWPLFVDNLLLDPLKNVASQALLDSIMAIGILLQSGNLDFESSAKEAWIRFNNAYLQLPQIIALGPSILAIEAILTMALFVRMTADACTAVQLVSSAVRMYQMAALQNDPTRTLTLGASDDRHRRAFWTAYILDREISIQFGLPLAIDNDEFDVVPQRQKLNIHMQDWSPTLQMMPEIALMESIVYKRLYQRKAFEQADRELIMNIVEENLGLYFWIWPTGQLDVTALGRAARATLSLIPAFPRRSFVDLWRILCYPISASINLLTGVLENPLSTSAKSDVSALRSFRQFLERAIQEDACDLHRVLRGCTQMENLAQNAIEKAEAMSTVAAIDGMEEGTRLAPWDDGLCRQAQKIKDLLVSCTHPMYLAQGLMTNMKTRDSATTEALSEVLGISEKGGRVSGLLAPECLWPKTNGFPFRSTPRV
ncbi:hypothetical protein CIB48_g2251 [Xylaria polymorpha]|nr:hypothetical protein CIB48_g2251 [Xylaria polymorpha]